MGIKSLLSIKVTKHKIKEKKKSKQKKKTKETKETQKRKQRPGESPHQRLRKLPEYHQHFGNFNFTIFWEVF
jgi:hypothetical protein